MLKKISILAFALTVSPAFANPAKPTAVQYLNDPNPSSRFGTNKNSNVYVTGDFLYFQPLTSELSTVNIPGTLTIAPVNTKYFEHAFKPGFRVSLGYNANYDGWDLNLIYTQLDYKHNNKFVNVGNFILPAAWGNVNDQGTISYTYNYYQGDLDLGRMFKVSNKFNLRPHLGIRGLWLIQKAKLEYLNSPKQSNITHNRFKSGLGGIEAGIDSLWTIAKKLSVYGNLGFTGLVDSQKLTASKFNSVNGNQEPTSSNSGSKLVLGADFAIGLTYDMRLSQDRYHLGIKVGYEQHILSDINSLADQKYLVGTSGFYPLQDSDFRWQAVTAGLRFDF